MSLGRLHDKVAVVTGSTKGIGEALVTGFAREGASGATPSSPAWSPPAPSMEW
jgi:NAD(P)-dependent dehydrogenase (short-subunit alcohol dehydrogenase family)